MFGRRNALDVPAFGDAHLATSDEMEAAGLFADKGIRLGYYRSPKDRKTWGRVIRYSGDGGLILVAPPRSGKARDVLVGALLEYDQSVIVVDPKGQLAAITKARREQMGQRVVVLNPFNVWPEILGPTARYNPMALLDPFSPTFGAECRKLAEGLIAKSNNERDSHWTDGARTLVSSVIGHLAMDEDANYRNLAQMRENIAGPEVVLNEFAKSALKSPHAFIRQGLAEYAVENAPNKAEIAGKISTAREQTFFLSIDTIADNIRGDDFRFGVLKKEPVTVYVILPDEHLDTCGKWFRLVVASALHDLWRGGRGAYRVLAILDEFAHIGHLDILEKAAGMAAGHGLQLWPVLQNLTQLKKDYGDNWETFIAGSEIRQFFATRDQTSAKYVSETSGQRTVTTAGQSVQNTKLLEHDQSSDSAGQAGQPLVRPHEISGFGPHESLIFGPRNIVIDGLRQPYFHTPEFAELYSPDPQHAADAAPPPSVNPESVIAFADTHAAVLEKSAKALAARRPMFFRLLTWGSSDNPTLNALLKAEFVLTLPLRIPLAILAAPFALHNKPPAAVLVAVGLAGLGIFGAVNKDLGSTKDALTKQADLSGQLTARARLDLTPNPRLEMGEREAEVDAETRIRFFELFRDHWWGSLVNMTGANGWDSVIRLNAAMYNYQSRVTPFGPERMEDNVAQTAFRHYAKAHADTFANLRAKYDLPNWIPDTSEKGLSVDEIAYFELPTRTPLEQILFLNAITGCHTSLVCTSMDSKVRDAYRVAHPGADQFLIFQGGGEAAIKQWEKERGKPRPPVAPPLVDPEQQEGRSRPKPRASLDPGSGMPGPAKHHGSADV